MRRKEISGKNYNSDCLFGIFEWGIWGSTHEADSCEDDFSKRVLENPDEVFQEVKEI